MHDGSHVFQQDNASIHSSNSTKSFPKDLDVTVLEWTALSLDLNPIENVWGMLVRDIYCGGKQYTTVEELKIAIRRAWGRLKLQKLQNLLDSMPDRVGAVLEGNGKKKKYERASKSTYKDHNDDTLVCAYTFNQSQSDGH
ncbi:hypothetical protein PC128_g16207 [Phytophthora cactorum]|nr:hypothetical protein PC128_g16207 [Phytophthora cactorum]